MKYVILFLVLFFSNSTIYADIQLFGPTPYLSSADSPFVQMGVPNLFIEDFEGDPSFDVLGVTATVNGDVGRFLIPFAPNFFSDSVDGDDGLIDGLGRDGYSLAESSNTFGSDDLGYTFAFNQNVLGHLPTHVGIVWTDGSPSAWTQVEFFGNGNQSLGLIGPFHIADGNFAGGTAEDRFFGIIFKGGVESFVIRSPGGTNNLTVDHLQFNTVPEPGSVLLIIVICIGATLFVRPLRMRTAQCF